MSEFDFVSDFRGALEARSIEKRSLSQSRGAQFENRLLIPIAIF